MDIEGPISPQPRQSLFLRHPADVVIFGGGAFGGKSFALLMKPLQNVQNPEFKAVIFRLTYPLILKSGGIWDDSHKLYLGQAEPLLNPPRWKFPTGATISFEHLEDDKTMYGYKSAQIPLVMFDQLEEQAEHRWWYLFSRNRSTCGVKPCIRATCNPDAESWLAVFLSWWIDQDTGYPIQERAAKIRWMARDGDEVVWANTAEEIREKIGPEALPKSVSFIPSLCDDNPIGMRKDPGYRANLQMQTTVERERLEKGNWKIRPQAGLVFPRTAWQYVPTLPVGATLARAWDKAASASGSGARTAGVLMAVHGRGRDQRFFVVDVRAGRWGDLKREEEIRATAELDRALYGSRVTTHLEEEGGSGGKSDANATVRNLAGFVVFAHRKRTAKHVAWRPLAVQQQRGNVFIVTGIVNPSDVPAWNYAEFVRELDALAGDPAQDGNKLRDCADAASLGLEYLTSAAAMMDRELVCSGEPEERRPGEAGRKPMTDEEISDLPDDVASVLRDLRTHGRGGGGLYLDDDEDPRR
jgi:phage terminase large subunit-like protein